MMPYRVLLVISLSISAFTHLWNPIGFPDLFYDEGIYMRRAMHTLIEHDPQEAYFYDHPHFGQIFLSSILTMINYPSLLEPSDSIAGMRMLYIVPRILMGILAVIDTFLIYMIAMKRYGKDIAIIASIMFGVVPITWFLRRILLDSIFLPFVLGSILLALYCKGSRHRELLAISSGILLGLAIYTKIPASAAIPLVAYLIYTNSDKDRKRLIILWLIPIVSIPLLWPIHSIARDQFDLWVDGVTWQVSREGRLPLNEFIQLDPIMLVLSISGLGYSIYKRDYFLLLWFVPFAILFSIVYVQYFHVIPIIPALSMASARFILSLRFNRIILSCIIVSIICVELIFTIMVITTDVTSAQFETVEFIAKHLDEDTTLLASPIYTWIPKYVLGYEDIFLDYRDALFYTIEDEKILVIVDGHFMYDMQYTKILQELHDRSTIIRVFYGKVYGDLYPYTNIRFNLEGSKVEIRLILQS